MVHYLTEMPAENSKCGEYRSFGHLLLLWCFTVKNDAWILWKKWLLIKLNCFHNHICVCVCARMCALLQVSAGCACLVSWSIWNHTSKTCPEINSYWNHWDSNPVQLSLVFYKEWGGEQTEAKSISRQTAEGKPYGIFQEQHNSTTVGWMVTLATVLVAYCPNDRQSVSRGQICLDDCTTDIYHWHMSGK